jgi:hypothetical protein
MAVSDHSAWCCSGGSVGVGSERRRNHALDRVSTENLAFFLKLAFDLGAEFGAIFARSG